MNITDTLLVHLKIKDKDSALDNLKKESALICRKISISPSESALYHSNLNIQVIDTIFSNTEEKSFTLNNIEGIIPIGNHKILVTLLYCNNYYEVICDAIIVKVDNFILCNPCINSHLLPTNKYNIDEIEDIFMANESIPKFNTPSECHKFVLNKIINVACGAVHRRRGPSYNLGDPNKDKKSKAYLSCQIHSIEVLQELPSPPLKDSYFYLKNISKNSYSTSEETIVYETAARGFSHYNNLLYFHINKEDKNLYFSNSREGIKKVRDSDSYNGFGYDEVTIYYSILGEKKFQTRFLLEQYVENIFLKCNSNNISVSEIRIDLKEEEFALSNIHISLKDLESLFNVYFVESYI